MLDSSTDFGRHVAYRLKKDRTIWLTTVGPDGTPQPRPVWFLWNGETFLLFSRSQGYKIRHIQTNPRVALSLDSDGLGGDIVVFLGDASLEQEIPPGEMQAYLEKYQDGLVRIGMSAEVFGR